MAVLSARRLFTGPMAAGYRGADRRGVVARLADPASVKLAAWAAAAVVAVPLAGVGVLSAAPGLPVGAVSLGAADVALVAFLAAGLTLLVRWRLVGEAAGAVLAALALIAGLVFVPATHFGGSAFSYVSALQTTSLIVILGAGIAAQAVPEVWADLRPTLVIVSALVGALALALPLSFAPVMSGAQHGAASWVALSAAEGAGCLVVAIALFARGVRRRHPLFAAAGVALLAVAGDCAGLWLLPLAPESPWADLPSFFLVVGATALLLVAGVDLRSAISATVLHDVRGRRRWLAAETELARVRTAHRGQSHDITSMLSAVDGTLLVLSTHRDLLAPEKPRQLIVAIRGQIQQLTTMLAEDGDPARPYDLSELLAGIVAIRASQPVRLAVEPALELYGRPDRVTRLVNNLLANATVHAPAARVTLTARRAQRSPEGEMAELIVADDGPGLTDAEIERAFEPGWRGEGAAGTHGSGLGLHQCLQLACAEGGGIVLRPTRPSGAPGARGLTARVLLPARQAEGPVPSSSILRMRPGHPGANNGGAVPDRTTTTPVPERGGAVSPAEDRNAHRPGTGKPPAVGGKGG